MRPLPLLLALSALTLCACSTPPVSAPSEIPPIPVALATKCQVPENLYGTVTEQDVIGWAMEWINAWACERGKRAAIVEAWPR